MDKAYRTLWVHTRLLQLSLPIQNDCGGWGLLRACQRNLFTSRFPSEAVILNLKEPVRVGKRLGAADKRQELEAGQGHSIQYSWLAL